MVELWSCVMNLFFVLSPVLRSEPASRKLCHGDVPPPPKTAHKLPGFETKARPWKWWALLSGKHTVISDLAIEHHERSTASGFCQILGKDRGILDVARPYRRRRGRLAERSRLGNRM